MKTQKHHCWSLKSSTREYRTTPRKEQQKSLTSWVKLIKRWAVITHRMENHLLLMQLHKAAKICFFMLVSCLIGRPGGLDLSRLDLNLDLDGSRLSRPSGLLICNRVRKYFNESIQNFRLAFNCIISLACW